MDSPIAISLDNVSVNYHNGFGLFRRKPEPALHAVSFNLYRGETLGVIGRNGAGKSTLLRLLAGILEPDVGNVERFNNKVSLLALQAGFDKELSGLDNIYLSALLLGFSHQQVQVSLDAILAFAELGDAIHRPVKTYSSGMRARLGFSVAFQLQPDVLLVDEVLGVGDIKFKQKSVEAMKARMRTEQTFVLVSHHGPTIQNLCKRAVWIDGGTVKAEGPAKDVVAQYEQQLGA